MRQERACKPVLYSIDFWGCFVYCWVVFRIVKIFAHYSPIHVALKFSFGFENIVDVTLFLYFCFISVLWLMWYNFPNEVMLYDIRKEWAWKNILRIIRSKRAEFMHHKLKVHKLSFQTKGKKNHFCPCANYLRYANTSYITMKNLRPRVHIPVKDSKSISWVEHVNNKAKLSHCK